MLDQHHSSFHKQSDGQYLISRGIASDRKANTPPSITRIEDAASPASALCFWGHSVGFQSDLDHPFESAKRAPRD